MQTVVVSKFTCLVVGVLAMSAAASPRPRVVVISFQSLGTNPELISELSEKLRREVGQTSWPVVDAVETQRASRSATMCGEDLECLATLGQRVDAAWVLAWGYGKVGSGALFTSLLVETATGAKRAEFSERIASTATPPVDLVARAVGALFTGLSPPTASTTPVMLPPPPAPPAPRFFIPKLVLIGIAGASAIVGAIFTALAATHFHQLQQAPFADRAAVVRQQVTYNVVADASFGLGAATGIAALVLFFLGAAPAEAP